MAIAYVTSGRTAVAAGTQTLSIDCGTDTDKVLFVISLGSNQQSTTVTFDGNAMTAAGYEHTGAFGGGSYYAKLWYYINPGSGSKTISVGGATANGVFGAAYSGVDQTTPVEATSAGTGGPTTTLTDNVTTVTDNSWLFQWVATDGAATNSAGTSTTLRQTGNSGSWCDSNAAKTPTGSYSIETTFSNANYGHIWGAIKPAGAAAASAKLLTLLGVGK